MFIIFGLIKVMQCFVVFCTSDIALDTLEYVDATSAKPFPFVIYLFSKDGFLISAVT